MRHENTEHPPRLGNVSPGCTTRTTDRHEIMQGVLIHLPPRCSAIPRNSRPVVGSTNGSASCKRECLRYSGRHP